MKLQWKKAALCGISVAAAAALGVLLGGDMKETYLALARPWYAPPTLTFLIIGSILYPLMGYALYQALTAPQPTPYAQRGTVTAFACGLILSALWPAAFFRFRLFTLSFFLIVAMLAFGAFTEVDFYKVSRRAAACYLPYLLWLAFALFLNHAVARLNS